MVVYRIVAVINFVNDRFLPILFKDALNALEGLGPLFKENSLKARRNLRGDLERHGRPVLWIG